jgi:hypothetical protein
MVLKRVLLAAALALPALCACAPGKPPASSVDLSALPSHGEITVLVFFSPTCHCLTVHDGRLVGLYGRYHSRGVELLMIDSETTGSGERDTLEAQRRGYPFPIVRDQGAKLADALGARFASYSVVLDARGRVRYRGGIDSDKSHLHEDAHLYLEDAIGDLLAGRSPRVIEGEALGCELQTW